MHSTKEIRPLTPLITALEDVNDYTNSKSIQDPVDREEYPSSSSCEDLPVQPTQLDDDPSFTGLSTTPANRMSQTPQEDSTAPSTPDAANNLAPLAEIKCKYPHLHVEDELYFHGLVRSIDTMVMLTQDQSFLVHQTAYSGEQYYVLSYRWCEEVNHAIIGKVLNAEMWFIHDYCATNIVELIDFHCSKEVPVSENGALIKYAVKRRDWSLNVQQLKVGKAIGRGEFGLIYKATIRRLFGPNKKAVVKILLHADKIDRFEKARLFCEAQLMMSLRHKNVLQIYGICTDGDDLILALERASNGSLLSYISKKKTSDALKVRFCKDLSNGMAYLSNEGVSYRGVHVHPTQILHRDLAARNCLVSKSCRLKVADFGLSTSGLEAFKLKEKKVPIRWLAPEVLRQNQFSGKSDSWSFGVVLFEIWSNGQRPYDEIKDKKLVKQKILKGYRIQPPKSMPDLFVTVMNACFVDEPSQRASLVQINDSIKHNNPSLLTQSQPHKTTGSAQ